MQPDFNTLTPVATSQPDFSTLQPAGQTQTQPKSFTDSIWSGLVSGATKVSNTVFPGAADVIGTNLAGLANSAKGLATGDIQGANERNNYIGQPTLKQDIGVGLQLAPTVAGLAGAPEAGSLAANVLGTSEPAIGIGKGILQGARAGGIAGAALGTVQGAGNAATANQGAGGIASSALKTGLMGAGLGAGIGAVGGGISGALNKAKAPATLEDSLDMTRPTMNKKASIASLEKSGMPGGATKSGMLGSVEVQPSPRDLKVAQSVQDAITKGDPIDTIANINGKIENVAENQIRPALQQSPSAFNLKTLNAYIRDNTQIPNYIKADPVLERTYELTRDSMVEEASNQPKTLEGLWDARKSFDSLAERQGVGLDPTSEKASVIKQAVLDTRRAVNDFIVENHPDGQAAFGQPMQQLNQMYEARTNIATSNYKALNTNAIQRWIKTNPEKARLLGYGLGAIGLEKLLKFTGVPLP